MKDQAAGVLVSSQYTQLHGLRRTLCSIPWWFHRGSTILQNTDRRRDCSGLLPPPTPSRLAMSAPCTPRELRAFSQARMFNRVQAFWRIYKNSLCLTCTKPKCNALLKQDSKLKTTAKHYLQPKPHFAIWTQAQSKYCSSTSLLFFKNQGIFGSNALFPLFK